jgi:hypothetical protein
MVRSLKQIRATYDRHSSTTQSTPPPGKSRAVAVDVRALAEWSDAVAQALASRTPGGRSLQIYRARREAKPEERPSAAAADVDTDIITAAV